MFGLLRQWMQENSNRRCSRLARCDAPGADADALALIAAKTDNAVFLTDALCRITWVNDAFIRITGYSLADVAGLTPGSFLQGPDTDASTIAQMQTCVKERRGFNVEILNYAKNNETFWLAIEFQPIVDGAGKVGKFMAICSDITLRKKAELLERDRGAVLEMMARNRPLPEVLGYILEIIERQRPRWKTLVQRLHEDRLYAWARGSAPVQTVQALDGSMATTDAGPAGQAVRTAQPAISRDQPGPANSNGPQSFWAIPIVTGPSDVAGVICVFPDDSAKPSPGDMELLTTKAKLCTLAIEHQLLIDRLASQVQHDFLTGLPNRLMLESRLREKMTPQVTADSTFALLFMDVDGITVVNDSLGHYASDMLLQMVAARLQATLGASQLLVRIGANAFIALLDPPAGTAEAETVADRLLSALVAPFDIAGHEIYLLASIGVSIFPRDATDPVVLQRHADLALHEAKNLGGNRVQFFVPEFSTRAVEQLQLSGHLRRAIEKGELCLDYQPQVNRTGRIIGVEALIRWRHSELGMISPGKFIPLAEKIGMIIPIGNWVLSEACRQAAIWRRQGLPSLRMAVNVSAMQFAQTDFVARVEAALSRGGLEPFALEIELTESLLMKNTADAAEKLGQLRHLGVTAAIDDFGTGYSSLAYLQKLPIDTLKIDQSFVCEIRDCSRPGVHEDRHAVIRAITLLAHSLRMKLVGEGVETETQRQFLLHMGCHSLQGFLFARPAPASEIEKLLLAEPLKLARSA